jgi:hypothetical protein
MMCGPGSTEDRMTTTFHGGPRTLIAARSVVLPVAPLAPPGLAVGALTPQDRGVGPLFVPLAPAR